MDIFSLVISIVLISLFLQLGEAWLVIGIGGLLIISTRSAKFTIFMLICMGVLYFIKGSYFADYWIWATIGLIAFALLLGIATEEQPQQGGGMDSLFGGGGMPF